MIISPKYKFIFLKTHKVAGSSVEKVLLKKISDDEDLVFGGMQSEDMPPINVNKNIDHDPIKTAKQIIKKRHLGNLRDYFKLTIERNPWDKTVSAYHWMKYWFPTEERFTQGFENFIFHKKLPYCKDWEAYTKNNIPQVDFIMQFDNLNNDMKKAMKILQIVYNDDLLSTCLKSNIRPGNRQYRDYYSTQSRKYIQKLYRYPIEYFSYTF